MFEIYDNPCKPIGVYRCPDDINNFKLRIKIKEIPDVGTATQTVLKANWETKEFQWQEKVYNNSEKYSDAGNRSLEIDSSKASISRGILFSYVDSDEYTLPENIPGQKNRRRRKSAADETTNDHEEYDYIDSVRKALENLDVEDEVYEMYIMADIGEYLHDIWVGREHLLCFLNYNKTKKILKVFPDFTGTIAYHFRADDKSIRNFYYFIEHTSADAPKELTRLENEIFKRITNYKRCLKLFDNFNLPTKNKLIIHIFFEITTGADFENDDLHVTYTVDLPDEKWTCRNPESLNGTTQTCRSKNDVCFFAHSFDLNLEYDISELTENEIPKRPAVYFEVVSRDSWDRYRCEGLTYHFVPITKPGYYNFELPCYRLVDGAKGNLRRFFVGDSSNYNDISWIGLPKHTEETTYNKYGVKTVTTGRLGIRTNVLHQSQAFLRKYNSDGGDVQKFIFEKLNSSSLVKSVEQVLQAFRKARQNMIQARDSA